MENLQKDIDNFLEKYDVELSEESLDVLRDLQVPGGVTQNYLNAIRTTMRLLLHHTDDLDLDSDLALSLIRTFDIMHRDIMVLSRSFRDNLGYEVNKEFEKILDDYMQDVPEADQSPAGAPEADESADAAPATVAAGDEDI